MTGGDEMRAEGLPGVLAEVARLVGVERALVLAEKWGGQRQYLPSAERLRPDHEICRILGRRAARLVCAQLGGAEVAVPSARAQRTAWRARELRRAGRPVTAIAEELGLSERHAQRLVAGVEAGNGGPAIETAAPARCALCGRRHPRPAGPRVDPRQLCLALEGVVSHDALADAPEGRLGAEGAAEEGEAA